MPAKRRLESKPLSDFFAAHEGQEWREIRAAAAAHFRLSEGRVQRLACDYKIIPTQTTRRPIDVEALRLFLDDHAELSWAEQRNAAAEHFKVHADSIRRVALKAGWVDYNDRRTPIMTLEKREAARKMIEAEPTMPGTWIAETVGVPSDVIRDHFPGRGPDVLTEWIPVWQSIRKNPDLLKLHYQFAPKATSHYTADMMLKREVA